MAGDDDDDDNDGDVRLAKNYVEPLGRENLPIWADPLSMVVVKNKKKMSKRKHKNRPTFHDFTRSEKLAQCR